MVIFYRQSQWIPVVWKEERDGNKLCDHGISQLSNQIIMQLRRWKFQITTPDSWMMVRQSVGDMK